MFKNFDIAVDTTKGIRNQAISVNTNDLQTLQFSFTITQSGVPVDLTGATVRLAVKKPDKNTVFQDCTVTDATAGKCEIILDTQAYIVPGLHPVELMVYYAADKVSVTGRFSYTANKGILDDSSIVSTNEFQAITQTLTDVENIVVDLRDNGTGIDAQARSDLETVNTQLDGKATEFKLSSFGLTPSDTDSTNFSKLCTALDTGEKIIVDNMYTIKVGAPYTLTKDVNLNGENPLCGFAFENPSNTHVFIPTGNMNIKMYQIKISGIANVLFYNLTLANFIKEVDVTYCDFSGQIAFNRFSIPSGDFDLKHGCGDLLFKHNKLENLAIEAIDNGAVPGFITVNNHPINTMTFDDNNVKNFKHNIIYAGTTNTHQNTAQLALNRKIINVNRNIVINDDGIYDDDTVGMYHSFIIAECRTLNYRDNEVEGLKSATGKSVYDVYASCMNYYCENNTWKNNVSFNLYSGSLNNCLMKFKGNPDETKTALRVIKGNRYTIDSDFASRHGKEDKWLHVFLTNITSMNISVDITENTIEVPYLNFGISAMSPKTYKFSNNTIKAKRVMGAMCRLSTTTGWNNSGEASVEMDRNTIIAEEENNTSFDFATNTSNYFSVMYHSFSSSPVIPKIKNISMNNNYIKGDMRSLNSFSGLFEYIQSKSIGFSNNTIINLAKAVYTNSINKLFYNSQFNTIISTGNVFENMNIDGGFTHASDVAEEFYEKVLMDNYIRLKNYNASFAVSTIPFVNQVATRKLRFDMKFRIIKPDLSEHEAKFKCLLENGKFTYINSTTLAQTIVNLTGTTTGITYYTESPLLRMSLRDDAALTYGRKVSVTAINSADLANCEIYVTLRINTDPIV